MTVAVETGYRSDAGIHGALVRYRILATIVGISLVVLVFVAIPLQVFANSDVVASIVGIGHGVVFFPLYLLASFDLSRRMRWSLAATISVLVAGVVPIGSFYVEQRVRTNVNALLDLRRASA